MGLNHSDWRMSEETGTGDLNLRSCFLWTQFGKELPGHWAPATAVGDD